MHKSTLKTLAYGAMVTPFAIGFYVANYTQKGCQWRQGQWHISQQYCIAKDCREKENCGQRKEPNLYCDNVNVGDNLDNAYFWLGEPNKINDNQYHWTATQHAPITIETEKSTIIALTCK